jgi:hypothetical protein
VALKYSNAMWVVGMFFVVRYLEVNRKFGKQDKLKSTDNSEPLQT